MYPHKKSTLSPTELEAERQKILLALANSDSSFDYVWDGEDEDDRPLTAEEFQQNYHFAQQLKRRGRLANSAQKEKIAIRLDHHILEQFRKTGKGWQTRINQALSEWLATHTL
ncbi:hypothetical protein A4G19_11760 [Pasteurellaceae bacterium Macca]|nr:hypothetical protein [Pasteurellaceae bacterium Macca]